MILELNSEMWHAFSAVTILVLADVLLGIILAIRFQRFDLRQLPKFLQTGVLPVLGSLLVAGSAAMVVEEMLVLFYAAVASATVKYLADIKDKLTAIFGELET